MNRDQSHRIRSDLGVQLDRLVGGELSEADRRALLLHLEDTPDGWRRCALAFLEDQAWRSALAEFAPEASIPPRQDGPPILQPPRRSTPRKASRLALAAGLLAVALGSSFWAGTRIPMRPDPSRVAMGRSDTPAQVPSIAPEEDGAEIETTPGQPLGWVGLVQQDDGRSIVRPVPYLASTPANAAWVESQPPTIPEYVRAQLERQGYQIEENHRLVNLDLQDGRQVAIPVDEVDVNYVARIPL